MEQCACKPRKVGGCWPLPEAARDAAKVVTWSLRREHGPRDTSISDFQTADLRVDKSTLF